MFTSDPDQKLETEEIRVLIKDGLLYLGWSLFFALFGAVYEVFSHEVYSYWMIYAFAVPLVLGVLPCLGLSIFRKTRFHRRLLQESVKGLYRAAVITLTVGCSMKGVLEIYGTTNRLMLVYWFASAALFLASVIVFFRKQEAAV